MRSLIALSVLCCASVVEAQDPAQDPAMIIAQYDAQIAELTTQLTTATTYRDYLESVLANLPPFDEWTPTHAMIFNTVSTQLDGNFDVIVDLQAQIAEVTAARAAYIASLN